MRTMALHSSIPISLVVGCLAASAWGQAPAGPSQRDPGGPVSCVVKITCDPFLLPLNPQSLQALLESSLVTGEAFKQAMRSQDVDQTYFVEFKPLPGGTIAAPAGVMPVTPMMGMMGGVLPQPPQPPQTRWGFGREAQGPKGGEAGGPKLGSRAPTPDDLAESGRRGGIDGPQSALPVPLSVGPMTPGAAPVPPVSPGMPGPAGLPGTLDVMLPTPRESSILGQIEVQIDGVGPRENEAFLRAVCERLQQSLSDLHDQELASIRRQMQVSRDELARAEGRLRDLQKRRRDLLGADPGDLVPEAVMDQIRRLDHERQRMEMDLLGQQARLKAVQQQIQATGERSLGGPGGDEMIRPLQAKLEVLRNELKRVEEMFQRGMVPAGDVEKARVAVLEAEIQLVEARRRAVQIGGGEVLGKLNTELAMLSVNVAETMARLKYLREQMEKSRKLVGAADAYEMEILMEMPHARRAYESSKLRVEEMEQRIRTAVAPTVTVIGGATSKPAK